MRGAESLTDHIARSAADQERREARAIWQEHGGSRTRPLKSFRTAQESAEMRAEHAEMVREAVEAVATVEGARAFLVARSMNPHLSAGNAAICAYNAPNDPDRPLEWIVGTASHWRKAGYKIGKGERAAFRLTGTPSRKFFPTTCFTGSQVGFPDELAEGMMGEAVPMPEMAGVIAWAVKQALRSRKPSARLLTEIVKAMDVEAWELSLRRDSEAKGDEDDFPF